MEAAPFFVPLLPILYRVFCPKRAASSFSRYPSCPPAARPEGFLFALPRSGGGLRKEARSGKAFLCLRKSGPPGRRPLRWGTGGVKKGRGVFRTYAFPERSTAPEAFPLRGRWFRRWRNRMRCSSPRRRGPGKRLFWMCSPHPSKASFHSLLPPVSPVGGAAAPTVGEGFGARGGRISPPPRFSPL